MVNNTKIALMAQDIEYIKRELKLINIKLDNSFVTRLEFNPVRKIAYGVVATAVTVLLSIVVYAMTINN